MMRDHCISIFRVFRVFRGYDCLVLLVCIRVHSWFKIGFRGFRGFLPPLLGRPTAILPCEARPSAERIGENSQRKAGNAGKTY